MQGECARLEVCWVTLSRYEGSEVKSAQIRR